MVPVIKTYFQTPDKMITWKMCLQPISTLFGIGKANENDDHKFRKLRLMYFFVIMVDQVQSIN